MENQAKKLSHYTIFTDAISEKNTSRIVYSTRSTRSNIISEKYYHFLTNNQFEMLPGNVFEELVKDEIIVNQDEDELQTIINENKQYIEDDNLLYQVIQPSAMCQLGCDYCGQEHKKVNIKTDLIEKLVERLRKRLIARPGFHRGIFIGWFGGEPLMALNEIRILTERLKGLANEFNISYGSKIVTNGLSLKPAIYTELAKDLDVRSLEITLDGTAEYHDQRRNTKEGHNTFDLIFKNLQNIFELPDYRELNCPISIRCNVDKRNYLGVSPLIKKLAENDFHKFLSYFYVASVYSWGNDAHLKSFTKEEFSELEIDWMIEQMEFGFRPGLLPGRVRSVCLAVHKDNEMVDAYGNLFNCTEVSYVDVYKNSEYVLGNLKFDNDLEVKSPRPLGNWNDQVLNNEYQCHSCKMLPVCGGGCPKSWHEDMRSCPSNKFNIKEKLVLSYLTTKADIKELTH